MEKKIPYGRQSINQSDIDEVVAVLQADFLTQGPAAVAFETAVADFCGAKYAIATNSATSALHLACLALGVGPGDCVWTTPITFVASSNCALYCGATIDFVDIDPETYNLSVHHLAEKLERAAESGLLPKVVIPVHLCGLPCDMEAIHALSVQYDFKIIEDASHAIGARYQTEPVGSCRFSHVTIFSFHPVKIITTGEGGMAVTNDSILAEQMMRLRSHGITRSPERMLHFSEGPWYYEQLDLGFNYRMTDIQAALGVSQIKRIGEFLSWRHFLASRYDRLLSDLPVQIPTQDNQSISAHHLYVIRLSLGSIKKSHRQVFEHMHAAGILVNLHYIPVYRQPYYKQFNILAENYPQAEKYYAEAMSLPMHAMLTIDQQDTVVNVLRDGIS